MPSFNQVVLAGHLTRDVELKYLQSGTAVCDLGLAINDRVKRGNDWVDEPCFVDCTLFGKTAEVAGEYLSKGAAVLISGRLKLDQWESQDGQKRSKLKIIGDKMQMLGGKRGEHDQSRDERRDEYAQAPAAPSDEEGPF